MQGKSRMQSGKQLLPAVNGPGLRPLLKQTDTIEETLRSSRVDSNGYESLCH